MKNRLYDLIFPTWFLIKNPLVGIILLFGNYFWDKFVFWIVLRDNPVYPYREKFENAVMSAFLFGLVVDFMGLLILALTKGLFHSEVKDWLGLEVISVLLLCGLAIFYINRDIGIDVLGLPKDTANKLGIYMGTLTTPWLFLIPPYYGQL